MSMNLSVSLVTVQSSFQKAFKRLFFCLKVEKSCHSLIIDLKTRKKNAGKNYPLLYWMESNDKNPRRVCTVPVLLIVFLIFLDQV